MKKFFLFFLVGLFHFAFVSAQTKTLSFEDLSNTKLQPKYLQNIQWVGNTEAFTFLANNTMVKALTTKDQRDTLLRLSDINEALTALGMDKLKRFPAVKWSNATQFTLVVKNSLLRYDMEKKKLEKLNSWDEKAANTDIDYTTLAVAYTRDNNLYLAVNSKEIPITAETNPGIVYGSERVHRNEWGIEKGTFWSPNGNCLAFYRMDETMVADYPLVDIDARIARLDNTKYPMAGEKSHEVTLGVYDVKSGKTIYLKTAEPKEQFLTNISWAPDEKSIYIQVLNRAQNHMKLNQYDAITGDFIKTLLEEKNDRYVEPQNPLFFLTKSQNLFIYQSQVDGWNHLYLYDVNGKMIKQLTKGAWVVTDLKGIDADEKNVYFMSTMESPLETHLYAVNIGSGKITKITTVKGTHSLSINPAMRWFVDAYANRDIASEYVVSSTQGKVSYLLQKNENPLKDFKLGELSIATLKAKDGTDLYYRMIKPVDFDPAKKYPALVYVYGGPHAQMVTESWLGGTNLYFNHLATLGYVVFTLDNRGSARRGFAFESIIHRNTGKYEMEDQLQGVEYLKSLPYVDASRLAVDGWSYGGFMTLSLMLRNPGLFKVATCGGPVVDWKFYEVMYGERYMDTPQENPEGYKDADMTTYVKNLKGRLLVLQGYQDNTVLPQNCLSLLKKSVDENVLIDFFVYPGHEHNVRGKDRLHMYKKLEQYYKDYL